MDGEVPIKEIFWVAPNLLTHSLIHSPQSTQKIKGSSRKGKPIYILRPFKHPILSDDRNYDIERQCQTNA